MATLKDLRNRIKSVKSTQKITKAMKMVAAAKLRKAQDRAEKGRPYSDKMNSIITNLNNSIVDKSSAPKLLVGNGKDYKHLCIVMTADRGLCGGFNTSICRKARLFFNEKLKSGKELSIITVGSKGTLTVWVHGVVLRLLRNRCRRQRAPAREQAHPGRRDAGKPGARDR